MKKNKTLLLTFLLSAGGLLAQSGSDDATQSAYSGGWSNGSNGGTGFGSWTLTTSTGNGSQAGFFKGTSTTNGDGDSNSDGDINTGGNAFGMYANSGQSATATRTLSNSLDGGDQFQVDFDNGWIESGGSTSFRLQTAGGADVLVFSFTAGQSDYKITGTSIVNTGIGFSDEGFTFAITLDANGTGATVDVTPKGGSTQSFNIGISGTIARFQAANINAGSFDQRNFFINSISYTKVVLAAELVSWKLTPTSNGNQLQWGTAMEKDAAAYQIERSNDSRQWETIGTVYATNRPQGAHYTFLDASPADQITNYYRLAMVDTDGKVDYSNVIAAEAKQSASYVVAPNPITDGVLRVQVDRPTEDNVVAQLFDVNGKLLHTASFEPTTNVYWSLPDLVTGTYFLRINSGDALPVVVR